MVFSVKDVVHELPMTQRLVHCVIKCDSCDFIADEYLTAYADAKAHYAATGHDMMGDACFYVKIGSKAKEELDAQIAVLVGQQ